MRRFILIWTLLIVCLALQSVSLQLSKLSSTELKVDFALPEFETKTTLSESGLTHKLTITDNESATWNENLNGLPQTEQWIYVPAGYRAEISLQNPVITHRQNYSCDIDDAIRTGQNWLDVSEQMRFRGNSLVSMVVKPFVYDSVSKELSVMETADISIRFVPDEAYAGGDEDKYRTPTTVQMLKGLCLNRDDIRESTRKPGSYVILYNGTTYETVIQTLAEWKRQKGFDVRMVNTSTIGNNTLDIKAYLQNAYDTWSNPPEFVFILGKTSGNNSVPTYIDFFNWNTVGDYKFTTFDGDDLIPDAYVGRATFSNSTELQTILNKTINYEKHLSLATTDWSNRSLLLGDPSNSGASCITTINYIKGLIQNDTPDMQFTELTSGYFPTLISAALNNPGVGTYWYRGHGDFSGYSIADINSLNNIGKYPFMSYITCFTGSFGGNQGSQAEAFLKAGSPSSPKGVIAVVSASCETHTCTNNILTGGIAAGLYVDKVAKAGPAMVRGKLAFLANFPQNPSNYLEEYSQAINLLGDPGVDIWLQTPSTITVTYPEALFLNGDNAAIRVVDANGIPVANAWVTLYKNTSEQTSTGYTDEAGLIVLPYMFLQAGTVKLTVTKPDYRTFQVTIPLSTTAQPITLQPIPALDTCFAGSTLSFPISLMNGVTNLVEVTGILSSLDADVSISQADLSWGDIAAGAISASAQNCTFSISSQAAKGKVMYLNLHLIHSTGTFDIPIICTENGANLEIAGAVFGGNLLVHGTNSLMLSLHNAGLVSVSGLTATLDSTHPLVTVTNPGQSIGTLNADGTVSLPAAYTITVADTIPEGVIVTFYLELQNATGFRQRLSVSKAVGSPSTNDITGPDAYGYICYGPGDAQAQPYSWIELDPALGGAGTNLNFVDTETEGSGVFSTITMPFQFRYYGVVYSQITICSNGYIMPGNQGSAEWMNWSIPGAMVPRPIIAPFWDDLLTDATGKVLYRYDAGLHAFIVQWQGLKNRYSQSQRETFEAILYDPLYANNPTGDSPILFQYKLFNNVDQGNYGGDYVDHGQFATVGIGDHTGLSGLQYTFNNTYPTTAQTLANFTTLYFTTLPNYLMEPNPIIINNQITEINGNGNGQLDAGELIDMGLIIRNTGLGTLNETTAILSSTDPYVMVTQGQATLSALFTNQMATTTPLFRVQITQDCPNLHTASFTLTLQNSLFTFPLTFDLSIHAINITMTNLLITDSNDNFPAPGETVTMSLELTNVSLLNASNITVNVTPPLQLTISPLSQVISLAAGAHQILSYNVVIGYDVVQGTTLLTGLSLTITGVYNQQYELPMLVGIPDIIFSSDFEEADPWLSWIQHQNAVIDPAQYINPAGNEAVLFFSNSNPNSYVLSRFISANDIIGGQIRFKYQNLNPTANFGLLVSYDGGQTLLPIWQTTEQNDTPQTVVLPLENIPTATVGLLYAFLASKTGQANDAVILDDVEIMALHHAPGIISGHLNLDLYPEQVTAAEIQVFLTDTVVHPDASGYFEIPCYAGTNYLNVTLDGYLQVDPFAPITVVSGQTTADHDIIMEKLRAPIELTQSMQGNQITLNWNLEGDTTTLIHPVGQRNNPIISRAAKNERLLTPNYYRIFLKRNNFTIQDTSSTETYTRNLTTSGTYHIYVQGVYLFEDGVETFSDSSNVIVLNFTGTEDDGILPVFALQQNVPNPFNPVTAIKFSVPVKKAVSLVIYNVKGQAVKTLLNSEISAGAHSLIWDGKDDQNAAVGSGVYYYRLKTGNTELTKKMVLLK